MAKGQTAMRAMRPNAAAGGRALLRATLPMSRRAFCRAGAMTAAMIAFGGAGALALSGCSPDPSVLRVGTKIDVPGFGFQNPETGNIEGMEVDIARELAKRIKGDPNALRVTGVNVTTRGAMLDNGTLDAALATFTITEQRKKSYNFSQPYYVDHIGVLVKKSSGIVDLSGLDGKTVGVALSATTRDKLEAAGDELGIRMFFSEYSTYPEIKIALVAGRVDAFSVDSSILKGYLDNSTMLLGTNFAPQEYGVATKKSNVDLAEQVETAIATMQEDGTLASIQERWGLVDDEPVGADVVADAADGGLVGVEDSSGQVAIDADEGSAEAAAFAAWMGGGAVHA